MFRRLLTLALLALLIVPALGQAAHPVAAAQATVAWQPLGPAFPTEATNLCFDPLQANTLLAVTGQGTIAYNWTTDKVTLVSTRKANGCGGAGYLFATNPAWRFSTADPVGRAIAHVPTHLAADGSGLMYSLERPAPNANGAAGPSRLWASTDAGRTWTQRGQQFAGMIENLAVAEVDAYEVYALVVDRRPNASHKVIYTVWYSFDGGADWQQPTSGVADARDGGPFFSLDVLPGHPAPSEQIFLSTRYDEYFDATLTVHEEQVRVSTNRGATFTDIGRRSNMPQVDDTLDLVQTAVGLLRRSTGYLIDPSRQASGTYGSLDQTTDGGTTWSALQPPPDDIYAPLQSARVAPANVFWSGSKGLWYAPDSGHTWQQIAPASEIVAISPYVPLTILRKEGTRRFVGELPGASKSLAAPSPLVIDSPYGAWFGATGHYIPGIFQQYYVNHGGLAQFGLPRTEAVPEVNAANGLVYLTQYFERNRFEYHPENAGTKFEVELGLLGSELTAARRAAGEAPFARVPDPDQPINEVRYFPQTGHSFHDPFMRYWDAHGGLDTYGYPISEPFQERNPADGKTYTVQYFERNRLEYHPENAGTPYEILLGLLGNDLLKQKGWQ